MANGERLGPRVQAEKLGTADQGGGQLIVSGDVLQIRGRLHSRQLGSTFALQSFRFLDPGGRQAELIFEDRSRWSLTAQEDGLLEFARDIEGSLGRTGLVTEPPRMSEHVREAMGENARRRAVEALLTVPAAIGCRALVGLFGALGWVVLAVTLPWVLLLGIGVFQREPAGPLARVRAAFERRGWALTLVLPMALAFGAGLGMQDAAQRRLALLQVQELAARQRATDQARSAAQAQLDASHQREVTRAAQRLAEALNAQKWEEAEQAQAALATLDPEHPALPASRATLDPRLKALHAEAREVAIRSALRDVGRMQSDPVVCDDVRAVAASWKALRELPTDDPRYPAAVGAVQTLERCRRVVAKNLAANTEALRRQQRARVVPVVQDDLRRAGHVLRAELEGRALDTLVLSGDALNAEAVRKITQGESQEPNSFLDRRRQEGVRSVRFVAGKRTLKQIVLKPPSAAQLAQEILSSMALGEPLTLEPPAPPEAPEP